MRSLGIFVASVALLACSPVPEGEGEDGGVTTDPSGGGGVTSIGPSETGDEDPPGPGTAGTSTSTSTGTSTSTTGEPPPQILDIGGGPGGVGFGGTCTDDLECASNYCYIIPFLGGYCSDCKGDQDCPFGGCTSPNPFTSFGAVCNGGDFGAGCETDAACQPGLFCDVAFDLLGLVQIQSCGSCRVDGDCLPGELCVAEVVLPEFYGVKSCMPPGSLGMHSYCDLETNGHQACQSGFCVSIDIMGLAEIGACGDCLSDADCGGGSCISGEFDLESGELMGSTCQ